VGAFWVTTGWTMAIGLAEPLNKAPGDGRAAGVLISSASGLPLGPG
jgi:hypothetical protein